MDNGLKTIYLDMLRQYYEKHHKVPTNRDAGNINGLPSKAQAVKEFGSWNSFISMGGFMPTIRTKIEVSKVECISLAKQFFIQHGKSPSIRDAKVMGCSKERVLNNFSTWNQFLIEAELPYRKTPELRSEASEEDIIKGIKLFYRINGRIPGTKEAVLMHFTYERVVKVFSSWATAIKAAGFTPRLPDTFGVPTLSEDGHVYRSILEANFANKYLFNKYTYIIEPKYENSTYVYDWYIKELDIFIELYGGLRPKRTLEKMALNSIEYKSCIFVDGTVQQLNNYETLEEVIEFSKKTLSIFTKKLGIAERNEFLRSAL